LELVGFQDGGFPQPKGPHDPKAECLTAGGKTRLGSDTRALGWSKCQDSAVSHKAVTKEKMEAQAFSLLPDGSIKNKKHGLCMKRAKCTEGGQMIGNTYILAPCLPVRDTKLKVAKAQANDPHHMREMGLLPQSSRHCVSWKALFPLMVRL